ncbi:GntR family transcriptional regulator [Williamsia sp. Leaf354]|uniref:GntR family transcriptional regulator n=1 Tax=Williamsia sp. Leaf354 TaxID=1736349 RepID=UPI0006FF4272|nr:GntR family transcriptional regulator [Williamsia sp. Leaf354]KQR99437.1 GntR family transcriptional regulator [Williamsia sp. Leaf354]
MTVNAGPVAAERAYAHTKAQIISGGLAGGQLVSEAKIGAELGISRTPVHEAFLRLDAEQLIELVSRKGAIIRPMTPSEATDVLAMRQGIESASAAQTFAAGGPDAEIAERIEENLRRQEGAVGAGDVSAFVDADDDFHALLIEASRNPLARQFYEQLRGRQQRLRTMYLRIDPGNLAASYADHRTLADCFVRGDRDGFTAALVAHLERYQGAI